MRRKKAFALVYYKIIEKNKLSLNGYVLNNIKLEDKIYVKFKLKKYQYVIKQITAYKTNFENIEKGMSAELIVEGTPVGFNLNTVFLFST